MSAEIIEPKNTFEAFCRQHGRKVNRYHCNNDHFAYNVFLNVVAKQKHTISFCGVNIHHHNGLIEKAICNLQEQAE